MYDNFILKQNNVTLFPGYRAFLLTKVKDRETTG
jgi:hypothetical protein